jgi:hypothetical protein
MKYCGRVTLKRFCGAHDLVRPPIRTCFSVCLRLPCDWSGDSSTGIGAVTLPSLFSRVSAQLDSVLMFIRRGNVSPLLRHTLQSVIVLDVHKRDVVTALHARDVKSVDDFEWMAQLRYFWEVCAVCYRRLYGLPRNRMWVCVPRMPLFTFEC